jgi:hypothetical protein
MLEMLSSWHLHGKFYPHTFKLLLEQNDLETLMRTLLKPSTEVIQFTFSEPPVFQFSSSPLVVTLKSVDSKAGLSNAEPAGAMASVIYFPGAPIYPADFNVNQNFKKKLFLNNSMFQFFS